MAFDLFKLAGSIFIDTDKANESLSKTDKKAQNFGKTLGKAAGVAAGVGTALVGMGVAATKSLIEVSVNASETADNIDKLSQRLGLSREAYQELDFVLAQAGVDITSFQTGMKSLLKNMDGVSEGNKTATENFEKLGVSVLNANGTLRTQEEVLFDTVRAFQSMEDSAEKSRLAQELFGKQGQEIIPLLNSESGSFDELINKANELGLVLSDDVVDAGVEMHDLLNQLQRSFDMLKTSLGGAIMPLINDLLQFVVENMPFVQETIAKLQPVAQSFFDMLVPMLKQVIAELLPVFEELIITIQPQLAELVSAVMPILIELMHKLLPFAIQLIQKLLPVLVDIMIAFLPLIEGLIPLLDPIIDCTLELVDVLLPVLVDLLPKIIQFLTVLIADAIVPLVNVVMGNLAHALNFLIGLIVDNVMPSINDLFGAFKGLLDFIVGVFTGDFERAWGGIKDFILGILKSIGNSLVNTVNGIIDTINKLTSEVSKTLKNIPSNVPIIGGFKLDVPQIPRIPMLELGGTLTSAGSVLVGEKAPEILDLPRGARVTPLDKIGTSITKEDITDAFKEALMSVGINLELSANSDAIFDNVVKANTEYRRRHNGASALA